MSAWRYLAPLAALALCPLSADAQPTVSDDVATLMAAAQTDYEAGRFGQAEEKAEKAWAMRQTVDIAVSLGEIEMKLDKWTEATEHFHYAKKTVNISESREIRERIDELFATANQKVGNLRVQISVDGAAILIDGAEAGRSPVDQLFVMPGAHTVEARKEGYKTATRPVRVDAGQSLAFSITLEKDSAADVEPVDSEKPWWPTVLFASLAAAGTGVGIGLTVAAVNKGSEADDLAASSVCRPVSQSCLDQGNDLKDEQGALQTGGVIGFAAGGAALAGMIIYLAVPSSAPTQTGVTFTPTFGPRVNGASLTLSF